ncbi:MAG: hypothetical protein AB1630_04935 [bacterium]
MPVALPLEVYEVLERSFGREDATKVVKSFEATIFDITDYKWKTTNDELLKAIREEFITKQVFVAEMKAVEAKIENVKVGLEAKIENLRLELEAKIENLRLELEVKIENVKGGLEGRITGLNGKLNFLIILTILALTFTNPVVADIIKGLIK